MIIAHIRTFFQHPVPRSIGLIFAALGFIFGTWTALIPFIKFKFGLDEAQLGLLLLSLQGGILLMNPVSVTILHRWGAPITALGAIGVASLLFMLPMLAPNIWLLATALFVAGACFGLVNVAMNTCATLFELRDHARIMSTCHALWSTGAMCGSALASIVTGIGFLPAVWSGVVALVVILTAWFVRNPILPLEDSGMAQREEQGGRKFSWPNAGLWLIISISLCTNITEGTMADWSAVFMRDVVKSPEYSLGWGFSAYAFFMASGRFVGDALLQRFGSAYMLRIGGLTAAAGLFLLTFVPYMPFALCWFAMIGAGVSLGAPILYAAAARAPGMAQGAGLATMNTFAMAGFFGGPVLIGFLARAWSLPFAFAVVGFAALYWAWKAKRLEV